MIGTAGSTRAASSTADAAPSVAAMIVNAIVGSSRRVKASVSPAASTTSEPPPSTAGVGLKARAAKASRPVGGAAGPPRPRAAGPPAGRRPRRRSRAAGSSSCDRTRPSARGRRPSGRRRSGSSSPRSYMPDRRRRPRASPRRRGCARAAAPIARRSCDPGSVRSRVGRPATARSPLGARRPDSRRAARPGQTVVLLGRDDLDEAGGDSVRQRDRPVRRCALTVDGDDRIVRHRGHRDLRANTVGLLADLGGRGTEHARRRSEAAVGRGERLRGLDVARHRLRASIDAADAQLCGRGVGRLTENAERDRGRGERHEDEQDQDQWRRATPLSDGGCCGHGVGCGGAGAIRRAPPLGGPISGSGSVTRSLLGCASSKSQSVQGVAVGGERAPSRRPQGARVAVILPESRGFTRPRRRRPGPRDAAS